MELQGKRILVVGFGKTGLSTARFLLQRGARVTITDHDKKVVFPRELVERGMLIETGEHRVETFIRQDLIVISPGVSFTVRALIEAQARGIEVISEIELAYRLLTTPLIAVTGTNGKTTTTALLGHLFGLAGRGVFVGGNIGTPLIEYVAGGQQADYVIAEISSFQLEGIKTFRPSIGVLLNITEDHLDRYASFDEYIEAKSKLFMNQQGADFAVLNYDDPQTRLLARTIHSEIFYFSTRTGLERGAWFNGAFHLRVHKDSPASFTAEDALLKGVHNRQNMLAAALVGQLCGLTVDHIRTAFRSFSGLPHRMECIDEVKGVKFYNDSKGTNVGACLKSLESLDPPIILIAGGKDKGGSYLPLRDSIQKKVKTLILMGEARHRMFAELGDIVPTIIVDSLIKAVDAAFSTAAPGDSILFSPACSSFDLFKNYEHRGECFKDLVKLLNRVT